MKVTPITGNRGKRVFPSRCNLPRKEAAANFSCPSVYHNCTVYRKEQFMNEHEFELTEEGKREVQSFITECKTKRNEVLDNAGDTIKPTTIPTQKEILNDLNSQEDVDECGYDACWGVTDNYGMKIFLEYGIHFI